MRKFKLKLCTHARDQLAYIGQQTATGYTLTSAGNAERYSLREAAQIASKAGGRVQVMV